MAESLKALMTHLEFVGIGNPPTRESARLQSAPTNVSVASSRLKTAPIRARLQSAPTGFGVIRITELIN